MKTIFPTLSLLKKVEKLYNIKNIHFLQRAQGGFLSYNIILRANKKKYFLKQYRFDEAKKIQEIHRAKFFFANGGIPVILPYKNANQRTFFEDRGKFYALFPFVKGRIIRRGVCSDKANASAGSMLASIHLLSKGKLPHIHKSKTNWNKKLYLSRVAELRKIISKKKRLNAFDKLALRGMNFKSQLVQDNTVSFKSLGLKRNHLIHGDYHGQNIFFDTHDNVTHVFDIEKAQIATRSSELARSIDFTCFSNHYAKKNFHAARKYLSAYRGVYPMSDKEFVSGFNLYYLTTLYSLWNETEHYIKNNTRVDHFLSGQIKFLEYHSKHFDEFMKKLLSKVVVTNNLNAHKA